MASKSKAKSAEKSSAPKKRSRGWWRTAKLVIAIGLIPVCIFTLWFGYYFWRELQWAKTQLPRLDTITAELNGEATVILSADNKVLYRAQTEYRKPVKFEDIPKVVKDATLAAEDERFYSHRGIDYIGMGRALITNVSDRRMGQGASTITMQLAKRLFTSEDKSFNRKVKDMALAWQIEQIKTKDEILKLYLNQVFYGAGAYGISAAANTYFGKGLDDLTIAEAALLARLVQRPSAYNPFKNPDLAIEKRNLVLGLMRKNGYITNAQYDEAIHEPLRLKAREFASGERFFTAKYYVHYILDALKRQHPEVDVTTGGYRIETTIDTRLQKIAEESVRKVVADNKRRGVTTGAFVLMDNEGKILAMVGGVDYERNQYNMIAQGSRQPGSAMKPFVYAAALSSGAINRYESISDEPYYLETPQGKKRWPKGGGKGGSISIRSAIAGSNNTAAVWVCEKVGPKRAVQYCESVFGFKSPLDPVLSVVLGASSVSPLELAQGYSVFMLYGDRATPFGIKRVVAPDGTVLDDFGPKIQRNILDPAICEYMDECLRSVVTGGTARRASGIPNARGKTGTTSENRDAWFCGYTNNLVGIAWISSERKVNGVWEYPPMRSDTYGGVVSVLIWNEVMRGALKIYDDSPTHRKARSTSDPIVDDSEPAVPIEEPVDEPSGLPTDPDDTGNPTTPPVDQSTTGGAPGAVPTPTTTGGGVKPAEPPGGDVSIEICVESGGRANAYCPETVTRKMPGKSAPGPCRRHGPT